MKRVWIVTRREFLAYFNTPIAYIFIIVFLLINCGLFIGPYFVAGVADMRQFFSILPLTMAVFVPAVTMRLWAQEREVGTMKLLLSLPIRDYELVLGKYLAAFLFYLVALGGTFMLPVTLFATGSPDAGLIIGSYVGSILLGAFFLAVGLFTSLLFVDQIVAFITGMVICFAFYMLGTDFLAMLLDSWASGLGSFLRDSVGLSSRFESIGRGVLGLKDILYFFCFTVVFLILNIWGLESKIRLRGRWILPIAAVVSVVIAAEVNLAISRTVSARFDLTESGIYSVSPATETILDRLLAPVKVTYYVSPEEKMPTSVKSLQRDVGDKLREFSSLSNRFRFEIVEMTDELQEEMDKEEIKPFEVRMIEKDALSARLVYSAVSIAYLNKEVEIMPRLLPDDLSNFEYEIFSRVHQMSMEKEPAVAVFAPQKYPPPFQNEAMRKMYAQMGRPVPPPVDNFKDVINLLRMEGYVTSRTELTKEKPIDKDAQSLLIFAPDELTDENVKQVKGLLNRGGNLLIALQRYTYDYIPERGGVTARPVKSEMKPEKLLKEFGVKLSDDILCDPSLEGLSMSARQPYGRGTIVMTYQVGLPVQILVAGEQINKEMPAMHSIRELFAPWASPLQIDDKVLKRKGLKSAKLFGSSDGAWTLPSKTSTLTESDIDPEAHTPVGSLPLGTIITGHSPFPTRGEKKECSIIVVGCAEMFSDQFIRSRNNALFLRNCADILTLGGGLIGMRSKGEVTRYIDRDVSATKKLIYKILSLALVSVALAAAGIVRTVIRRRRRLSYSRRVASQVTSNEDITAAESEANSGAQITNHGKQGR